MDEHRELRKLRPQIIIATPGRLNDHIDKGNIETGPVRFVVIDEFDKCLQMGFAEEMNRAVLSLPRSARRIFLSATDTEALYDDSVELCRKLKAGNHPCELEIKKNVFHAYPMFPIIPEARETIADMFAFFYRQGVLEWP